MEKLSGVTSDEHFSSFILEIFFLLPLSFKTLLFERETTTGLIKKSQADDRYEKKCARLEKRPDLIRQR